MATRRIRIVVSALEGFVDRLIRKIVLDVVANLVSPPPLGGTPVDTGWARANWIPAIGVPRTVPAGTREAAEAGSVPLGAQQSGVARVATSYTMSQGRVHITNNVPYIVELNEGSSKQAPSGFVQAAIARAVDRATRGP
jgi:hypothetical protein